jgi:tetratricopeptide (TPR) repeat protein
MAEELKSEEEIERLSKIIDENPEDAEAYLKRGNAFYNRQQYVKAILDYNKAIEVNPDYTDAYNNRGIALNNLQRYEEAIKDYNKAIELDPNDVDKYFNRGNTYIKQKRYEEAIKDYNKAIELDPNDADIYYNRGCVCSALMRYDEAIQDYTKAIEIDPNYTNAYNNRGYIFDDLKRYDEAIQDYTKAIEIDPNFSLAYNNRGESYLFQKEWENAAQSFNYAKKSILDILSSFVGFEQIVDVVRFMIDYDDFFNKTTNYEAITTENKELYKKIYISALQIIASLHVKKESTAAHYTKRATASTLLFFKDSKFRLNSTITANDPQEGETLLKYLKLEKTNKNKGYQNKELKHDYQAFIGCFTFNHESLNQFRLYGKESDKEATGISLVLNKNFFNEKMDIGLLSNCFLKDNNKENSSTKDDQSQKYALYRCIYVDPKTHKIISLGHKEEYSFYREFKEIPEDKIKKDIEKYNETLDEIKTKVNDYFDELSKCIEKAIENKLNKKIICELLLPLRYLVKHVAYKEEQECRIFDIKDLQEEKLKEKDKREVKFTTDCAQMYIDYQSITEYVKKIYFAPKTEGVEIFEKALEQEGLNIECEVSSHPFS